MFYSMESMFLLVFLTEVKNLDDKMLALVGGVLTVLRILDAFNTQTAAATINQAICPFPSNVSVSIPVTGTIPTTTAYIPTLAQILAKDPMLSLCL